MLFQELELTIDFSRPYYYIEKENQCTDSYCEVKVHRNEDGFGEVEMSRF